MYLAVFVVSCLAGYAAGDIIELEEGDPCNDGTWTCKPFSTCESAIRDIQQGRSPEVCTYDPETDERIVCCRPDSGPKKRISQKKCEEYSEAAYVNKYNSYIRKFEKVLDCGPQTEQLIVGGKNAALKEFPHQAHIGYGNNWKRARWLCGGSLISDKWILSAAHCATPKRQPKWARLGELDYNSQNDGAEPKIVGIKNVINHENYRGIELYNDIALYELAGKVSFTPHIRPACLQQPDGNSNKGEHSALASGWGRTTEDGVGSSKLLKVNLNYVPNEKCNTYYQEIVGQLPNGIISSQLCAGNKTGQDACQGDSGGPLQRYLVGAKCMYELVGVTSFGIGCGRDLPGVYTRVSSFVPWIEKIVWPGES